MSPDPFARETSIEDWNQIRDDIAGLGERLTSIKHRLTSEGLQETDARLRGIAQLTSITATIPRMAVELVVLSHDAVNCSTLAGMMTGGKKDSLLNIIQSLQKNSKPAFLASWQFTVESMLKGIFRSIRENEPPWAYKKLVRKTVLSTLGDGHEFEGNVLLTASRIRNCSHEDGVHGDEDVPSVEIAGISFEFKKGEKFAQAGWREIVKLLHACVDVLESILSARAVASIEYIPSWWKDKGSGQEKSP